MRKQTITNYVDIMIYQCLPMRMNNYLKAFHILLNMWQYTSISQDIPEPSL